MAYADKDGDGMCASHIGRLGPGALLGDWGRAPTTPHRPCHHQPSPRHQPPHPMLYHNPNAHLPPPLRVSFEEYCKVVIGSKPTSPTMKEAAPGTEDAPTPAPAEEAPAQDAPGQESPAEESPAQEKSAAALVPEAKPEAKPDAVTRKSSAASSTAASIARAKVHAITTPRGYA